jgi:hypothetical protein
MDTIADAEQARKEGPPEERIGVASARTGSIAGGGALAIACVMGNGVPSNTSSMILPIVYEFVVFLLLFFTVEKKRKANVNENESSA